MYQVTLCTTAVACKLTIQSLRTPIRQAFSYGMTHSSLNHNENMPYSIVKILPYGSAQALYYVDRDTLSRKLFTQCQGL